MILKKYGKFWGSDEARLAAVEGYGTNQYDRKGQLEKLKIENLTTETYTYENDLISNLEALGID